jgi:hypothetical protein
MVLTVDHGGGAPFVVPGDETAVVLRAEEEE